MSGGAHKDPGWTGSKGEAEVNTPWPFVIQISVKPSSGAGGMR